MPRSIYESIRPLVFAAITAFACFTLPMQTAVAQFPSQFTERQIESQINKLPKKPFAHTDRFWGGPPGSKVGPALTESCERDIVAGLAFVDESYRVAQTRNLVTPAEANQWRAARAKVAEVMTANLAQQQIWNACIYRRNRIGELSALLPAITLSDATFVTCDGEIEPHRTAFAAELVLARASAAKLTSPKAGQITARITALEASTDTVLNNYRAIQPKGLNSLGACEATSAQIYANSVQMVLCRFGRCF